MNLLLSVPRYLFGKYEEAARKLDAIAGVIHIVRHTACTDELIPTISESLVKSVGAFEIQLGWIEEPRRLVVYLKQLNSRVEKYNKEKSVENLDALSDELIANSIPLANVLRRLWKRCWIRAWIYWSVCAASIVPGAFLIAHEIATRVLFV